MKKFPMMRNSTTMSVLVALSIMGGAVDSAMAFQRPARSSGIAEIDVRKTAPAAPALIAARNQSVSALSQQVPGVQVDFDKLLGSPKFVRSRDGFLTGSNGVGGGVSAVAGANAYLGESDRGLRLFLDEHSDLFGFKADELTSAQKVRDAVGKGNGLRTMVWEQQLGGVPIFEAKLVANLTGGGQLVSVASRFVPNLRSTASRSVATPTLSAEEAIVNAMGAMGEPLGAGETVVQGESSAGGSYSSFAVRNRKAHARLVWLPMDRDNLRLAWELYLTSRVMGERFQVLVDATTGETLVCKNLTRFISDASYNVYTSDSPSPFSPGWPTPNAGQPPLVSRMLVTTNAFSVVASPNGWINDGDNETRGNNADTYLDRNLDGVPDVGRPQGDANRAFDFPLDLGQDPITYSNAAVVQMFYKLNVYHDMLYELGFTEAYGNYQHDNLGRGGLGNDEIIGHVQAGADIGLEDNAFFSPAPDGINGEIAMFVWGWPTPKRDGDLDSDVIFHEATHGTSWRLVGGGMGLGNLQGDGMGEGWSDFYALSLLSSPEDDPDAVYAAAGYAGYQLGGLAENYYFGLRHFPYTTDMTKNPFTYKDVDPNQVIPHAGVPRSPIYPFDPTEASEVHHQGEIWCSMLWEVRANMIHKYGADGNLMMLQLITDAMKLTPASPTYVEARDAVILADQVDNGGANIGEIWRGFAKRGLGVGATSPDSDTTTGVVESFSTPGLQLVSSVVRGGNENGMIDPNECDEIYLTLTNGSGTIGASVTLTLATTTPGVYITVPTVTIPVFPIGAAVSNIGPFRVSVVPDFVCGTPVKFTVAAKSNLGANTNQFTLDTGVLGTPLRYDSSLPVAIPDNNPAGASSPIWVTNFPGNLGKVAVALFLQHTFDADLTLQLISPDGTTNVLAANAGGSGQNFGSGCGSDSLRTVFDDDATTPISSGNPPFIGVFKPQSPLAVFKGKSQASTSGNWQLRAVDGGAQDVGSIQCWSLILYPVECEDGGGQCPGANLALSMQDAPDPVTIGSNLVYTLNVTNFGPNTAKSVVVSQNLPNSVIFVSATTSAGTVGQEGGVLTANLGNLAIGATAKVTVVVQPNVAGAISSTASVSSTEPEIDPSDNIATATTLVQLPTADLAVSLSGLPNPTTVGGALTYTTTVLNNGPTTASGVVITNSLPASVLITSASVSQGSVVINGNVVICLIGTMTNGATATATINTMPLSAGTIFATARVAGNQGDPTLANNVTTIATGVGEAADLAISLVDQLDPIVLNSNVTYLVTVTNRGPNPATGVVVNQSLPAALSLVSSNVSQGSVVIGASTAVWSAGSLPVGGSATFTLVGRGTAVGTMTTSASVNGTQADPNPADNTAVATTLVATPFVSIVAAGATLQTESFAPPNGAVDVGETVSVDFRLRNAGNIPNTNVVATLLATGGVTAPGGPQAYGVLTPGGLPVAKTFTFTSAGTNGGTVTATLQISDGGNTLSNVVFTFNLQRQLEFTNLAAITIPDVGSATPYPSTIAVSGVSGTVGQVTATLSNLNHSFAPDVDVLLVSPTGQKVVLMAAAGGTYSVNNATVTFSDTASQPVPAGDQIVSGTYQPASYDSAVVFPSPAPVAPYSGLLSAFANQDPNGTWSLYVVDRNSGDAGSIMSGWRLGLTLISPVNKLADLGVAGAVTPGVGLVGDTATFAFVVTNRGPSVANGVVVTNTLSAGLQLQSVSASQGVCTTNGNQVVCSLGSLSTNSSATVTLVARAVAAGAGWVSASVAGSEIDLNAANNLATLSVTNNLPLADVGAGLAVEPTAGVVGSNLTYTVMVTNNGPGKALGTVASFPVIGGMTFQSAVATKGQCNFSGGVVSCSFGDLVANETAMATITLVAQAPVTVTNSVQVDTQSNDTNAANNTASVVVPVVNPRPIIVAVGATAVTESQNPPNGAIDAGETVTLAFTLANTGQLPTTDLVATLQASGGVGVPSGAQSYGVLLPDGSPTARNFTFTAPNVPGGQVTATLDLSDNGAPLGSLTFTFGLSRGLSFTNTVPIIIPDRGIAAPYPSTITVAGVTGLVGKVTVKLNGFTHGFPSDVDAMLVGPQGQKLMLMSDAGGGYSVTNLALQFDDDAAAALPNAAALVSGNFKPTDYESGDAMPAPAPAGVRSSQLAAFGGTDPNGNWSLYVVDDSTGDAGAINGGWELDLTITQPVSPLANLGIVAATSTPGSIFTEETVNYLVQVTNRGPAGASGVIVTETLPAGATVESISTSQGSYTSGAGVVSFNVGALAAGAMAQFEVQVRQTVGGNAANFVTVTAVQDDIDLSDNSATITTSVVTPMPAQLSGAYDAPGQNFQVTLTGQAGVTYVLQGSLDLATWTPIATNAAPGSGIIKFTDSSAPSHAKRFYRAIRLTP